MTTWDVARCYTLGTPLERGRASKGRFYWPCAHPVSGDGRWDVTTTQDAATAAKTLLDAINGAAAAVWSGAQGVVVLSALGAGVAAEVDRVLVGRAPDTQRRRTKALEEDYQTSALSTFAAAQFEPAERVYG